MASAAEPDKHRPLALARDTALVGFATVLSRVLGFARDVMLASALGTGPVADAFFLAFRIPNLVRRVLGEGGLNAGLVPVEQSLRSQEGEEAARRFAGEALANAALGVLILTILLEIAAPLVVVLLAPGFAAQGDSALASLFLRLSSPLLLGATLASLGTAILASQNRFGIAAFAPVAVNVLQVLLLIFLDRIAGEDRAFGGAVLALGMSVGGVLQALIVIPPLFRSEHAPRLVPPRWSPAFRRLLSLGGPGLIVVASTQLFVLIAIQIGSSVPGAVSQLHYADRVAQLPLGFVASALGLVVLPEFSRRAQIGMEHAFAHGVSRACELAAFFGFPAAVALVILAEPISRILFERGAFGPADTLATASALAAMAFGLPFAVLARVLSQAFFAREHARPALVATLLGLVATALAAWGFARFGTGDSVALLSLATSIGAAVQALALGAELIALAWWRPDGRLFGKLSRIALATVIMALGLTLALPVLSEQLSAPGTLPKAVALAALCVGGLAIYVAAALLLRALDWRELVGKSMPLA